MSKGKTLILINYAALFIWWALLAAYGITSGLGNSFFNLGMGLYALLLSGTLAAASYKHQSFLFRKAPTIVLSLGMVLFGLGTLFWFYYDVFLGTEIPFPSLADLFYLLQLPFTIFGLLYLSQTLTSERRRDEGVSLFLLFIEMFIFVWFVLLMVLIATMIFSGNRIDLETYLLFYFPLESFSAVLLSAVLHLKYSKFWDESVSRKFMLLIFGGLSWLAADCFFFIGEVTGKLHNAGYSDFLYATGVFLFLYGLIDIVEENRRESFISPTEPIYFQKITFYSPIDLNLGRQGLRGWLRKRPAFSLRELRGSVLNFVRKTE